MCVPFTGFLNKGSLRCSTLAATAELEKTGKGLITHTSVDILFYILFGLLMMEPAASKQVSSGAPIYLSCLSSDLSSGRSGTPSMLTPRTNLCYGWE